jgi:hypothetical protein
MSANRDTTARTATPVPDGATEGFQAQLEGASLWDLVQLECLARSHAVVEITGEGGVGHLYFDAGRVVHAQTTRQRGQAAALEILGWTHGTFQPSTRAWPAGAPTIEMSHEALLLHAAKARDDERASNLVAFPAGPEGTVDMRNPNIDQTTPGPPVTARGDGDFPVMVRLSSNGTVVRNKGGTEELAEATAYAHRLVQLTGELLGLDEFVALECVFEGDRFIVFTENDGDVVALRPRPEVNLQPMRERLGL